MDGAPQSRCCCWAGWAVAEAHSCAAARLFLPLWEGPVVPVLLAVCPACAVPAGISRWRLPTRPVGPAFIAQSSSRAAAPPPRSSWARCWRASRRESSGQPSTAWTWAAWSRWGKVSLLIFAPSSSPADSAPSPQPPAPRHAAALKRSLSFARLGGPHPQANVSAPTGHTQSALPVQNSTSK